MTKAEIIEECRAVFESSPPIGFEEIAYKPYPGTHSHDIATALHGKGFDEIVALLKTDEAYGLWGMWTFFTPEGFRRYIPAFMAAGMEETEESVHVRDGLLNIVSRTSRLKSTDEQEKLQALDTRLLFLAAAFTDFVRLQFADEISNESERRELINTASRLRDRGLQEFTTKEQILRYCRDLWDASYRPHFEGTTEVCYPNTESEKIAQLLYGKSFDEILQVLRSDVAYRICIIFWVYVTPEAYRAYLPVFVAAALDEDSPAVHMRDGLLTNVLPGRHSYFKALDRESRSLMARYLQFILRQYPDEVSTEINLMELRAALRQLREEDA